MWHRDAAGTVVQVLDDGVEFTEEEASSIASIDMRMLVGWITQCFFHTLYGQKKRGGE